MTVMVLHTADIHLGMRFVRGYPQAVQNQLVEARFQALHRLASAANKHYCDILVIAGDLFHRPQSSGLSCSHHLHCREQVEHTVHRTAGGQADPTALDSHEC